MTLRDQDCVVSGCPRKASPTIHIVPMCSAHGWEIAQGYRAEVLQLAQREAAETEARRTEKRERNAGNREGALVYYVQIGDYIKIGFSTRLRKRYSTLRADRLLAIEPGGPELERQRHREFSDERIDLKRENFRPSERLTAHVAALHARYGLPHWATAPRTSVVTRSPKETP
jgi:hypothetical protein